MIHPSGEQGMSCSPILGDPSIDEFIFYRLPIVLAHFDKWRHFDLRLSADRLGLGGLANTHRGVEAH